ncbi:MAG: peptidylprolyl isomerase [Sphingobacteriales bacterium]|nr:MAG: peptidylprolyl isomerase [Sphingobacteriales bacterium]
MKSLLIGAFIMIASLLTFGQPKLDAALLKLKAPETFKAEFITSAGNFTIEVYRSWAPVAADRFYQLIKTGYYNNCLVFRAVKNNLVQFGVSPDKIKNIFWQKHYLQDEPVVTSNTDSTICFARGGPATRKTSVFINLKNNPTYDTATISGVKGFVPFGKVISGMDVVRKLNNEYGNDPMQYVDSVYFKGNMYLLKKYPNLDLIKEARVIQ